MYSLRLTEEQREIRDTVRDFVAKEVKPTALAPVRLEAAERRFPPEILSKASQIGLRSLALSEALGGAGADALTACIVAEELAAGDVDFAATLVETSRLAQALFDRAMSAEQRARFLPEFIADDLYHLACGEREAGMDRALGIHYHRPTATELDVRTTGLRAGNGDWILNGTKTVVRNAPIAKLFAVQVKTDVNAPGLAGVTTFLVPRETPGLSVRELERPRGWHHGVCGDLVLTDCRVPATDALGPAGTNPLARNAGGRGIPLKQAMNLGVGRAAYEAALDYAKLRVQGGRRIVEHQAIGTLLAEAAIKLQVARGAVWQAAWAADHPEGYAERSLEDVPLDLVADVYTSEAIHKVALDAAEVFGAMGVMRDMPLQKYVRDALVFLHDGNGVGDTKLRIAEALAGFERPRHA
ncbi:MAG: acyl-CoA dehydrogenase family protein [Burkholderiales bacterium]